MVTIDLGVSRKAVLLLSVIWNLSLKGNSQLIGEEKKYVFLEQAVLERVRPILMATTRALETRVGHLEEENRRILTELNSMKTGNPLSGPSTSNGCPVPNNCADVTELTCPRFLMDPETLHSTSRYLTRDKLTLSNRRLDSTYDWPTDDGRRYQGVQGSSVITTQQTLYFETDIYYRINASLSATNLVFEVAFATEEAIGKSFHVGRQNGAWSVNAHNSDTKGVVLFFKTNGGNIMYSETLSDAISGTEKYLKLGFYINRPAKTISVFDINKDRKIYTFINVDSYQDLWPVFGVYQAAKQFVRLKLNTEKDITSVPCRLF